MKGIKRILRIVLHIYDIKANNLRTCICLRSTLDVQTSQQTKPQIQASTIINNKTIPSGIFRVEFTHNIRMQTLKYLHDFN